VASGSEAGIGSDISKVDLAFGGLLGSLEVHGLVVVLGMD